VRSGRRAASPADWVRAWGPPVLAALILLLILVPAEFWRLPSDDAVYEGFDPFLIYVDQRGGAESAGAIDLSPAKIRLVALPNSRPTLTVATTPLKKLRIEMDIRIVENGPGTIPFRVGIWTPNTRSGYFVQFGPSPANLVSSSQVRNGTVASTLFLGESSSQQILGSYQLGVAYHLTAVMDKDLGRISFRLAGTESPPSGHRMLRIAGRGYPPYASQVISDPVHVKGGSPYWFGGYMKLLTGSGTFGFVVEWIDRSGQRVSTSEEWRHVGTLETWSSHVFHAVAPFGATTARLMVGTSPGTEALFADLFLSPKEDAAASLLANATFAEGSRGWRTATAERLPLETLDPVSADQESSLNRAEAPGLFGELRLSVTANGYSEAGMSTVEVSKYRLTLPHQRWLVAKVEDPLVTALVVILLLGALGLLLVTAIPLGARFWRTWQAHLLSWDPRLMHAAGWYLAGGVSVFGLYAVLNVPMFNAGSLNYDLKSATVWLYTIPRYGLSQLYHLPTVIGPADSWGGVPFQEAAFPYGPVLAEVFAAIAWLHKVFFGPPGLLQDDSFRLAFSVKLATLLFTVADAVLIGLILRARRMSWRSSLIGVAAFLLNPAVIFVGSVWGQTQSISLFFLLLPIWADALHYPRAAWVTLALAALTRPQLLIAILLMAVYLIMRYKPADTIRGVAWGIVVSFLAMAPLALKIAPSVSVDLLSNAFRLHVVGENSPISTPISWGALSIWTLVTRWKDGQTGLERLSPASMEKVLGDLTYWDLGNILFAAILLLGCTSLLRRSREGTAAHVPAMGLGTLGLFVLKPSFAAFHLIPALALVIVWGEGYGRRLHLLTVALLSTTIFLPAYGMAGAWMSSHPSWNVGIFSPGQPITMSVMALFTSDWFLTVGSLANLAALTILAARTMGTPSQRPQSTGRE